jgi:hypothetical protein
LQEAGTGLARLLCLAAILLLAAHWEAREASDCILGWCLDEMDGAESACAVKLLYVMWVCANAQPLLCTVTLHSSEGVSKDQE